jgi:two-component system, sensor histidine kinase PdtaS
MQGAHTSELFRLALEAAPTGMLLTDHEGRITLVNAQIERLFGYTREELIGEPVQMLVPKMGAGQELYGLCKDGTELPIEVGLNPLQTPEGSFVLSSIVDITERRRAMEQLRERDVLLQEIHHRVKNNLQVISSLINMQIRKLEDGAAREVLAECKLRVEAIALIHEKLYQSRDYAQVPFSDYARSLAHNIVRAATAAHSKIVLNVECDPLLLPVDKAISCGLILNELITNALKHAYPSGGGPLHIKLRYLGERAQLTVCDEGVGMAEPHSTKSGKGSLGLQIVNTLTAQLDGSLSITRQGGTSVTVEFPVDG